MALKVAKPQPTPKLTVAKPTPQPALKVVYNYGMQGGNYNPQPASTKPIQGSNYNPQRTASANVLQRGNSAPVQRAATAAEIQAAANAVRLAVEREAARQKEIRRANKQGEVDSRIEANKSAIKLRVSSAQSNYKLRIGRNYSPGKITVPKYVSSEDEDEYNRIKAEAKRQAIKMIDSTKSDPSTDKWSKFVDKVTFGADRRAGNARKLAEQMASQTSERQVKVYQDKLDKHNKLQSSLQADYEKQKLRLSAAELNALADKYNAQMSASVKDLNRVAAYTEGVLEGYGIKAEEKLGSKGARAASFINRNVVQKTPLPKVWQYTLGEGSRNIPSIVTAPGRVVNWVGNLNTKDRQIYKWGGDTASRINSKDNAWQASFNQRSFNQKPWVDVTTKNAPKHIQDEVKSLIEARKKMGVTDRNKLDYDKVLEARLKSYNQSHRNWNSVIDVAADPLNLAAGAGAVAKGVAKVPKVTKFISKVDDAGRAGKYTNKFFKAADSVTATKQWLKSKAGESKIVQWLGKEAKSPDEQLADAIKVAKEAQGEVQKNILPRLKQIDRKVSDGKVDFSVFDDLATLTDSEAKMLQKMRAGKLTARDRLMLAGKNYAPIRAKLEGISTKWESFAENMRLADDVKNSRFGRGKRTYSPNTVWLPDRKQYNFRLKSKGRIQSADDFAQGAVDRYIASNLGKNAKSNRGRLIAEREELVRNYDELMTNTRSDVEVAYNKTRSPINRARKIAGAPMRAWKKSVLKYRPAWYVNNEIYNTQAAVLAAGPKALLEKAKLTNPRYWRQAVDEVPEAAKTNLSKEVGRDRLSRAASRQENWSRISAYRTLRKKGLSHDEALKRVDKYLFDYTTKNWERPLKTVMPFWAWQKNLTKAAVTMPFDRPGYAVAYNRLGLHQKEAFEKDFETVVPKLKELGYSDAEIESFKKEQAKYFAGRLKVGGKYYTTPFNAFSEKGLSNIGINPYIAALGETADAVDSFGRPLKGNEASLVRRLTTKFPQAELGYKRYKGWRVDKGLDKPSEKYIGKPGSEGYGLTKEKQGYDPSKPNYVPSMDPRTKTKQDVSAFLGKPRALEFDKSKFVETKKLQKVTAEYFSKSEGWKNMDYEKAEAERKAFFAKHGMTADDFYKGVLAKYDSDHTKKIKGLKEDAAAKNKALFDEYAKQPQGTRNVWATDKLRQLVAEGYFDDNPYLKSFKWVNRDTAFKADKQKAVQHALATGDWTAYRKLAGKGGKTQKQFDYESAKATGDWSGYQKKYGVKSAKAKAYQHAKSTGDWTAYRRDFGTKETPYKFDGKYFKTQESMDRYVEGQFWRKYAEATKEERRKLLAENSKYNRRADWTNEQWDVWKAENKKKKSEKLRLYAGGRLEKYLAENIKVATRYKSAQAAKRGNKKLAYR